MKRILYGFLLLFGISALFVSCEKNESPSSFYGSWYMDAFDIYLDNVKVDSYTRTKEGSAFYIKPDEPGYFYWEYENGTREKDDVVSIFEFVDYTFLIFDNGIENGLGCDRAWREHSQVMSSFETNYLANLKDGEEFMTLKDMFDETWNFSYNNGVIVQTNEEPLSGSTMHSVAGYVASNGTEYYWGGEGTNPKFKIIATYRKYGK